MRNIAGALTLALQKVAPISGVSIRDPKDKSTWRIDFKDNVTAEQHAAAMQVLAAFDANAEDEVLLNIGDVLDLLRQKNVISAADIAKVKSDKAQKRKA